MLSSGWYRPGFGILLAFRVVNALLVRTAYTPDEFFQSSEVAHWWTFGFGFLSWEWEPCVALRSALHPGLFKLPYYLIDYFGIQSATAFAVCPRIFQALCASLCDYAACRLTEAWYGETASRWACILCLFSWFSFFGMCRPYSNCLEACLSALALWMWCEFKKRRNAAFGGAAFLCAGAAAVSRPTATVFLSMFFGLESLQLFLLAASDADPVRTDEQLGQPNRRRDARQFWTDIITAPSRYGAFRRLILFTLLAFLCGLMALAVEAWTDFAFYRCVVFPPWNFLRFNGASTGASSIYGTQPFSFYIFIGVPVVLLSYLPLFVSEAVALCRHFGTAPPAERHASVDGFNRSPLHALVGMATLVAMLSRVPHKEERFLMQVHPMMIALSANALTRFSANFQKIESASMLPTRSRKLWLVFIFAPQLLVGGFMSRFHLKGSGQVIDMLQRTALPDAPKTDAEYLRAYFGGDSPANGGKCAPSVFFMTPCHHIPLYTHLHALIPLGFWDCSPDIRSSRMRQPMRSWRQRFWRDPIGLLDNVFGEAALPGRAPFEPTASDGVPLAAISDVYIHPFPQWRHTRRAAWFGGLTANDSTISEQKSVEDAEFQSPLSGVERCLAYRFQQPLKASQLPSHFVVSSAVLPPVEDWLRLRGYSEVDSESPILDSVLAESFDGREWWSKYHVFEHICR